MPQPKVSQIKNLRNRTLRTGDRYHLPLPTGKYQRIGSRDFMVGLTKKSGVLLRLFYPAADSQKKSRSSSATTPFEEQNPLLWPNWLPHHNYRQGLVDVTGIRSKFLISLIERSNKSNVFIPTIPNSKPRKLADGEKFPVIVFSHGLGGCRTTYSSICTELASHGFVVAAVEHRDNSACLSFYAKRARYSFKNSNPNFFEQADQVDGAEAAEDEVDFGDEIDDVSYVPPKALSALTNIPHLELDWVRYRRVPLTKTSTQIHRFRNSQIHQRVRECSRALDLVEALNAGYELNNLLDPGFNVREFENILDMEKITIMGHSMGGATALMSAAAELRFKTVVALDPWMYPIKDESLDLIIQPTMVINTETLTKDSANKRKLSEIMPNKEETERSTAENSDQFLSRQSVTLNGSKHLQQSDVPYVMGWFALLMGGYSMGRRQMNHITVHDLTCSLSIQFIAKFLDIDIDSRIGELIEEQKRKIRPTFKSQKM